MAVSNTNTRDNMYSIVGGRFTKRVPEGTPGAVERVLTKGKNEGQTVYELQFGEMSGTIDSISIDNSQIGDFIKIQLDDGDVLSLSLDSNIGNAFIKMLPNIESDIPVVMNTWIDSDGKTAFSIKQKEQYVKWAFTRENPNGMPAPTKKTVRGKDEWDWTEVENFLYEVLQKEMKRFKSKYDEDVPEKLQGVIKKQDEDPVDDESIPTIEQDTDEDEVKVENVPFG